MHRGRVQVAFVVRVLKQGINGTCRRRLDVNVCSIEKRHDRNALFHLWYSRGVALQSHKCHGALNLGHEVMSMQRCTTTAPWTEPVFPPPWRSSSPRPDCIREVPHSELLEEIPSPHLSSTYLPFLRDSYLMRPVPNWLGCRYALPALHSAPSWGCA